jgi:hypothetical protein
MHTELQEIDKFADCAWGIYHEAKWGSLSILECVVKNDGMCIRLVVSWSVTCRDHISKRNRSMYGEVLSWHTVRGGEWLQSDAFGWGQTYNAVAWKVWRIDVDVSWNRKRTDEISGNDIRARCWWCPGFLWRGDTWRIPEGCALRHAARGQFKTVNSGEFGVNGHEVA